MRAEQVLPGSRGVGVESGEREVTQIMYTPVNKCKNDKIKFKKVKNKKIDFLMVLIDCMATIKKGCDFFKKAHMKHSI
jgi:hypothetical protein